ncbi:MAG: N-acetylmuramoyl-L-alanine amidase [Crocinitomicaceae bacterium]
MNRRISLRFIFFSCLILTSFGTEQTVIERTVLIDIGHGGKDKGAQSAGLSEKDILQDIAEQITIESKKFPTKIIFLRDGDQFMKLETRVKKINEIKPDLLISLHINSSENKDENGITAIVSKENPFYEESHMYAIKLSYNLSQYTLNNRGAKDGNLFLLNHSNCPTVLLEMGYLTNEGDRNYLSSKKGQMELAKEICQTVN